MVYITHTHTHSIIHYTWANKTVQAYTQTSQYYTTLCYIHWLEWDVKKERLTADVQQCTHFWLPLSSLCSHTEFSETLTRSIKTRFGSCHDCHSTCHTNAGEPPTVACIDERTEGSLLFSTTQKWSKLGELIATTPPQLTHTAHTNLYREDVYNNLQSLLRRQQTVVAWQFAIYGHYFLVFFSLEFQQGVVVGECPKGRVTMPCKA